MSDGYRVEVERDAHGQPCRLGFVREPSMPVTGGVGVLGARKCDGCGLVFVPKRVSQTYHSGTCYDRAYNRDHKVIRTAQRALPGESRVERAFAAWIQTPAGRYVEAEVTRLALERKRAGRKRGEINLICAIVRDQSYGLGKDSAGFAVNNSYRAPLARRLMAEHPELAGWFETRDLRGRVA